MEDFRELDRELGGKETPLIHREKGDLSYWADMAFSMEHTRVATIVRLTHLQKVGRSSPKMEEFLELTRKAEDYADSQLAYHILNHPTWPWASGIKGIGKENYPKVVGLIEKFGRFYDVGDLLIPAFVTRAPELYLTIVQGAVVQKVGIWVAGIERLSNPSKLFKYAGLSVEDGHAAKREAGKPLGFNAKLHMALYRLGGSLLRARGIWYTGGDRDLGFSRGYLGHRDVITHTLENAGVKIVPTPKERMCLRCNKAVTRKKAEYCPDCGEKLSLKNEPPGYFFLGHLHMRALRMMMKDFSICLWTVWREALGLPTPPPYDEAMLAHPRLDPWRMVDRVPEVQRRDESLPGT